MLQFIKIYFSSLVIFGLLDFIWLGVIMKSFNNSQLASIAYMDGGQVDPHKTPALLVYLLMALAMTVFVGVKLRESSFLGSVSLGAILGLTAYGIYDLTNLSIIKDYPLPFALVDMTWGTVQFALTAAILFAARNVLA
jgi:uncharacterized membrane protein